MKKIIALAVAAVVAAPAMADLTIGASARYQADNSAATNGDFDASTNRVLVSVAGSTTAESGLFVSAGATLQMTGDAGVSRDGDNAVTIGNPMANVVLGAFEPAGAFSSGADQFQHGGTVASEEHNLRARDMNNIGLNVTAVEGLTFQVSTDLGAEENIRTVVGYDFGAAAVTAAYEAIDNAENFFSVTAGTTVGGVALNASYGKQDDANSTNINASYMGFGIAVQRDDDGTNKEQEVYGSYALANAGGVEGFTVTVGAGTTDEEGTTDDVLYGVRIDYAF